MITSSDANKVFGKIQHLLMIKKKSLSKGKVIEIQEHIDNKQKATETGNSKPALTLNLKITGGNF